MNIVTDLGAWRDIRRGLKGSVGFVPTMGHLHEGHASLCRRARAENDIVVVSIFVNPTQFNQQSDFDQYQQTFKDDCALLEKEGVDYVLHPDARSMYPDGYEVRVSETAASEELEGKFRPGHFTGMMTVVLKLLNLVRADRAYFGEKDFQQLLLVQKMVRAFFIPTEIVPCATVRAESGLALSSRNARLSPDMRGKAAMISQLLASALDDDAVARELEKNGFKVEYIAAFWGRRLAAAWLDGVRLIDNVPLDEQTRREKHAALS